MAPPPEAAEQIKKCFFEKKFTYADSTHCGRVTYDNQADERHINKVLAIIDQELIASKKFKVALDSVNGAGGPITKKFLSKLGCEVFAINDEPTGIFAHTPEPTAENLKDFCAFVKDKNAQIGFAQDPDADRLAIVDENGNYPGEEYTLALAAKYMFSNSGLGTHRVEGVSPSFKLLRGQDARDTTRDEPRGTNCAAANLSTSRMIDDIAAQCGGHVFRTPVGEANVAKTMIEHNCIIGGEGNGGVIDLRIGPIRDSLTGIALILQMMAETGKTIGIDARPCVSKYINEIGHYYMIKEKFAADKNQSQKIFEEAIKTFPQAKINSSDGYRFDFEDAWLHIRSSNTEPVMRVIAEAKEQSIARKYVDEIKKVISVLK